MRTSLTSLSRSPCQQPAGDTPGVTILPGVDKFIVTLSAQAEVFGVGATLINGLVFVDGSMLEPTD
jgi:hypothetical protein